MTDEIQESNPPSGSTGSPNPNASQGKGVQPTSAFDADQLLKQLEPLIEKKVQSVKDRRFDEMDKRLGGTETVLERVKELIPAEKFNELKKDLEFEELKRRVYGEPAPTSAPVTGTQQETTAVDTAKVVDELGLLDPAHPETAALKARQFKSADEAKLAVVDLWARQKAKPAPSASDVPTPQASPAPLSLSVQQINDKIVQLNKLYKQPTRYKTEIAALEKELEPHLPK